MTIIDQAKKIRAEMDNRVANEEEIRQILKALRNPLKLDLLQAVERIRKLVGL